MRSLALIDSRSQEILRAAETLGSPEAIDGWIRTCWQFEADPLDVEYIRTPSYQIHLAASNKGILRGDCDDASVLAASLLSALHWPVKLIAIRVRPDPEFSHVFVRTPAFGGNYEIDIDPIVPASMLPLQGNFELMTVQV